MMWGLLSSLLINDNVFKIHPLNSVPFITTGVSNSVWPCHSSMSDPMFCAMLYDGAGKPLEDCLTGQDNISSWMRVDVQRNSWAVSPIYHYRPVIYLTEAIIVITFLLHRPIDSPWLSVMGREVHWTFSKIRILLFLWKLNGYFITELTLWMA